MKKLIQLFLLVILSCGAQKSYASHMMGCDITYKCIDTLKFEVTLTWYRDCRGISLNSGGAMTIRCSNGTTRNVTLTLSSISEITPFCPSASAGCSPANTTGSGEGIEKHVYKGIVDFNIAPLNSLTNCSGNIIMSASINARNGAITTGPSGTLYNDATLNLQDAPCNSSPIFTTEAIASLCCDQPFYFNIGATDTVDRDSLSFAFAQPLRGYGQVTAYSGGFSYNNPLSALYPSPAITFPYNNPNSNPPFGIYLDPITGDLTVTPANCSEVTVVVIEATEWRKDANGVAQVIGKTRRDMQFVVSRCPDNLPPTLSGPYTHSVCEGNQLCFNITTNDLPFVQPPPAPTPAPDTVQLHWNEGIPGATFVILDDTTRLKTGRFCWTPPVGSASSLPYTFTATVEDDACPIKARTTKQFRVLVKKRAHATQTIAKINDGIFEIESMIDSSTFKGFASYAKTILDKNRTAITDSTIARFNSSSLPTSSHKKDTITLSRNDTFVVRTVINNSPVNCPTYYYDTIQVDSVFQTLIEYPNDTLVCAGESITLNTSTVFAQGAVQYQWYKNDTLLIGDTLSSLTILNIPRLENTAYSVHVIDSTAKPNTDKVRIRTKDNYDNGFLNTYNACFGDTITLQLDTVFGNILWSNGSMDSIRSFYQSGLQSVAYSDSFSCEYTDTFNVEIYQLPILTLKDSTTCASSMEISPGSFANYAWSTSAVTSTLSVSTSGDYSVLVTDSNGCQNSDTATIQIWNAPSVDLGNDTSQCGGYITLANNITSSQLWSTGDVTNTIIVSQIGEYSIATTDANGCQSSDTVYIDIYTVPSQEWADTTAFCSDTSVTLSSKLFATYLWNTSDITQTISISTNGFYSVYFVDNQGCSSTDSTYVLVNSLPVLNLGADTAFCENTLLLDAGNYPTIAWSTGSTSQTINVNATGTYAVTVIDANLCSTSDSISIEVFDNPALSLGNDTAFCGDSLLLALAPGNSYSWSTGDTLSFTSINTSGDYWLQLTDSNGCSASDTVNITLLTNTSAPVLTRTGNTINSSVSGTHQWFMDAAPVSGATDSFITVSSIGSYTAVSIDSNGCVSDTSNSILKTAGIGKLANSTLKVYPNPTNGKVTIDATGLGNIQGIKLYDTNGKLVENTQTINGAAIDLSWQARSGIYWIVVTTDSGVYRAEVMSVR